MELDLISSELWKTTSPSIALVETPSGEEVYIWTNAMRPLISVLSLTSLHTTHYFPRYPSPVLTIYPFSPFVGVLLLATDRTMRFVAEENSAETCISYRELTNGVSSQSWSSMPSNLCEEMMTTCILVAGQAYQQGHFYTSMCLSQLLWVASSEVVDEGCCMSVESLFGDIQDGNLFTNITQRYRIIKSVIQLLSRLVSE